MIKTLYILWCGNNMKVIYLVNKIITKSSSSPNDTTDSEFKYKEWFQLEVLAN